MGKLIQQGIVLRSASLQVSVHTQAHDSQIKSDRWNGGPPSPTQQCSGKKKEEEPHTAGVTYQYHVAKNLSSTNDPTMY